MGHACETWKPQQDSSSRGGHFVPRRAAETASGKPLKAKQNHGKPWQDSSLKRKSKGSVGHASETGKPQQDSSPNLPKPSPVKPSKVAFWRPKETERWCNATANKRWCNDATTKIQARKRRFSAPEELPNFAFWKEDETRPWEDRKMKPYLTHFFGALPLKRRGRRIFIYSLTASYFISHHPVTQISTELNLPRDILGATTVIEQLHLKFSRFPLLQSLSTYHRLRYLDAAEWWPEACPPKEAEKMEWEEPSWYLLDRGVGDSLRGGKGGLLLKKGVAVFVAKCLSFECFFLFFGKKRTLTEITTFFRWYINRLKNAVLFYLCGDAWVHGVFQKNVASRVPFCQTVSVSQRDNGTRPGLEPHCQPFQHGYCLNQHSNPKIPCFPHKSLIFSKLFFLFWVPHSETFLYRRCFTYFFYYVINMSIIPVISFNLNLPFPGQAWNQLGLKFQLWLNNHLSEDVFFFPFPSFLLKKEHLVLKFYTPVDSRQVDEMAS